MRPLMNRRSFIGAGALLLATACGFQSGTFSPEGFHQSRYDYSVRYADSGGRLMPEGWRLDNFVRTDSGWSPKSNGFYKSTFEFDTDKDERVDAVDTVPSFDLRFEHMRTGSFVWLRTIPAPNYESRTALYVLSRDYMAGISGAGYELAQFGFQAGTAKQFAVQLIETRPSRLAKLEALTVTIEVASMSELKQSAQAQRKRVKLVLVRAGLTHRLPATDAEFPTVLVAGYAARPDIFIQNVRDFDAFLGRIVLYDRSGYVELPAFKDEPG